MYNMHREARLCSKLTHVGNKWAELVLQNIVPPYIAHYIGSVLFLFFTVRPFLELEVGEE